ncbi:MAG: SRPBCC family protein [Chthoniobacteraceae bacterium]
MAIHTLQRTQIIAATIEECWSFFSNPKNLVRITPPTLDFVVKSELPGEIHEGLMIEYRVRPWLGIPVGWLTEITHVRKPGYFVDEQRVGPYAVWHHEHTFRELGEGQVEIGDLVHYVLPFGLLGEVLHPLVVKRQLAHIFDYRIRALQEIFPRNRGTVS